MFDKNECRRRNLSMSSIFACLFAVGLPIIYSSSRNTRDFNHEIRAQSEIRLHREFNLAMKNKNLRRIADVRSGRR